MFRAAALATHCWPVTDRPLHAKVSTRAQRDSRQVAMYTAG